MNLVCEIGRFQQMVEITINNAAEIAVWDPDSVRFLRDECRIFGKFIGSVARLPHKTVFKGLPLMLAVEEFVVLLKEHSERVRLVRSISLVSPLIPESSSASVDQYKSDIEHNYNEISDIIQEMRLDRSNLHFDSVGDSQIQGRKRKADGARVSIAPSVAPDLEKVSVHLPTSTPTDWLRVGEKETIDIPKLLSLAEVTDFVISLLQRKFEQKLPLDHVVKTAVFYNLWSRGHCVTVSCKKMGGDYLLYPGDPWFHHATHVVRILPQTLEIKPSQLISKIRLINSLKKTYLIAWYDDNAVAKSSNLSSIVEHLNISFNCLGWCGSVP